MASLLLLLACHPACCSSGAQTKTSRALSNAKDVRVVQGGSPSSTGGYRNYNQTRAEARGGRRCRVIVGAEPGATGAVRAEGASRSRVGPVRYRLWLYKNRTESAELLKPDLSVLPNKVPFQKAEHRGSVAELNGLTSCHRSARFICNSPRRSQFLNNFETRSGQSRSASWREVASPRETEARP